MRMERLSLVAATTGLIGGLIWLASALGAQPEPPEAVPISYSYVLDDVRPYFKRDLRPMDDYALLGAGSNQRVEVGLTSEGTVVIRAAGVSGWCEVEIPTEDINFN